MISITQISLTDYSVGFSSGFASTTGSSFASTTGSVGTSMFSVSGLPKSDFVSGSGTKVDPYVLQTIEGVRSGKSASSKEPITITNLQPETTVRFLDLNSETNEGRFNMADLLVEEDEASELEENESGSISFYLIFEDI